MSYAPKIDALSRNYLINGALDFFQRNVSAVNLTTSPVYANADRFMCYYSGTVTGTPQVQRSTTVPTNLRSKFSQQFICRRNASAVTLEIEQRIEAVLARDLNSTGGSFSCYINPDIATSVSLHLSVPTAEDNYTVMNPEFYNQSVTVTPGGGWQLIKFENISIPTNVVNGLQVEVVFNLPSGTDGSNVNHYITQMSFVSGSKAVDVFNRHGRGIAEELVACQRYYEKSYNVDVSPGTAATDGLTYGKLVAAVVTSGGWGSTSFLKVYKRVLPVISVYAENGTVNSVSLNRASNYSSAAVFQNATSFAVLNTGSTQGSIGVELTYQWVADAEL